MPRILAPIVLLACLLAACAKPTPADKAQQLANALCACMEGAKSPGELTDDQKKCVQSVGKDIDAYAQQLATPQDKEAFTLAFDKTKATCPTLQGGGKDEPARADSATQVPAKP